MKRCDNSRKCCYGNAAAPDWCAYDLKLENSDQCPKSFEDYEDWLIKMGGGWSKSHEDEVEDI